MNKKVSFYIPDFYYRYNLNYRLVKLIQKYPEWFNNFTIGAIYGSFPGAIWNGGRFVPGTTNIENIKSTIENFNIEGIPLRFTFTNSLLEEEHLNDTYCNLIMKNADNGMNEVLVNSSILENYLRDKYPNFKYILSTTKCERDINKINSACNNYDLVVTDFRDNKDYHFLKTLNQKDKIELLVDEYCLPDCKLRAKHYEYHSRNQLDFTVTNEFYCPYKFNLLSERWANPTIITPDELYTKYIDMGFKNFKIVGRGMEVLYVIESYVKYFAKPEYQDEVRYQLLKVYLENI